jgi:hypothetical protein
MAEDNQAGLGEKRSVSNCLLSHDYEAIDTFCRDPRTHGRIFELRSPAGEFVKSYKGIRLERCIGEMEREIRAIEGRES